MVFVEHLEKLEIFLEEKQKKMLKLTEKRLANEQYLREIKNTGESAANLSRVVGKTTSNSSSSAETKTDNSDDDLSDGTDFDDIKDKDSIEEYQVKSFKEQKEKEIEAEEKEEYLKKLMSFRKDELILPEESDDEDEEGDGEVVQKEKPLPGIEDAYELVEGIEEKMLKISGVIKGMDKRMSYNLRLIGSIVMQGKDNSTSDQAN